MSLEYVERVIHEYILYDSTTLFAALDIATGELVTQCNTRNPHHELLAFLRVIEKSVLSDLDLHLIVDNYPTHKHPKAKA